MTYSARWIERRLAKGDRLTVELSDGESAWNPACTTCAIHGPVVIHYRRYPDGGIEATTHALATTN